jgi:Carboxypeptidase regulatory-like domain
LKQVWRWLPIVLGVANLWLDTGVYARQQEQTEKFRMRGRVENAVTGEPVGGALVELLSQQRKAQFSAADGTFEFTELLRGSYMVYARKPGYFNERDLGLAAAGLEATHAVPADEDAVLQLTPEGIIYGQVEDEKGRPIEGVNVQAEIWAVANGTKRLQPGGGGSVPTDDQGNFRIAELSPGDYYLKFSEQGGGGTVYRDGPARPRARRAGNSREGQQGYGTQYYPGVVDTATATVIHAQPGVPVPVRQTLGRLPLYEVSGVVRGAPTGNGFSVTLLAAASSGSESRGRAQIFPNTGEFRIEAVPGGRYLLRAMAQDPTTDRFDRRQAELVAQTIIDVNSNMSGLALLLGHGATIGVRLTEELSKPGDYGHRVRVNLQSADFPQLSNQIVAPPPPTDPRAPRAFENVAGGTYSVEAWPEGWGYIASIRCAGTDLLKEDLKVGAGASVPPIEVRLRNDGAELNVSAVKNGKPVAARVIVYSEEYPKASLALMSWPSATTSTGNLAPGTYELIATVGFRELEYRNPAVLAKYLAHATNVTLAADSKVNVQVEVQDQEPEP